MPKSPLVMLCKNWGQGLVLLRQSWVPTALFQILKRWETGKALLHLDVKHRVCSKGNRNHAFLINLLLNQWSVLDKVLDVQEAFLKEPNGTLKLVFDLRRGAHFFPHDPIPKLCDFQNLIYKQNFIALRIFPLTPTQRWLTCILHYHSYFSHYLSVYLFCQCSFQ